MHQSILRVAGSKRPTHLEPSTVNHNFPPTNVRPCGPMNGLVSILYKGVWATRSMTFISCRLPPPYIDTYAVLPLSDAITSCGSEQTGIRAIKIGRAHV